MFCHRVPAKEGTWHSDSFSCSVTEYLLKKAPDILPAPPVPCHWVPAKEGTWYSDSFSCSVSQSACQRDHLLFTSCFMKGLSERSYIPSILYTLCYRETAKEKSISSLCSSCAPKGLHRKEPYILPVLMFQQCHWVLAKEGAWYSASSS